MFEIMNKEQLFELYSKLYFHEMEIKEKLIHRIQMLFVLIISVLSAIAYMMRTVDYTSSLPDLIFFYTTTILSFVLLSISIVFAIKAFWRNEYQGLPTADVTEQFAKDSIRHQKELKQYEKDYPDHKGKVEPYNHKKAVKEYLYKKFLQCSSYNTKVNDRRSENIHQAIKWLLYSLGSLIIAGMFFIIFDLDTSSPRKSFLVEDNKLAKTIQDIGQEIKSQQIHLQRIIEAINLSIIIKGDQGMTEEKNERPAPPPPQPPAEPEPRRIIEDSGPKPMADGDEIITERG